MSASCSARVTTLAVLTQEKLTHRLSNSSPYLLGSISSSANIVSRWVKYTYPENPLTFRSSISFSIAGTAHVPQQVKLNLHKTPYLKVILSKSVHRSMIEFSYTSSSHSRCVSRRAFLTRRTIRVLSMDSLRSLLSSR